MVNLLKNNSGCDKKFSKHSLKALQVYDPQNDHLSKYCSCLLLADSECLSRNVTAAMAAKSCISWNGDDR